VNPFAILGFNTTVLGGISDDDIVVLVNSIYRALSKIHHPDAGGNQSVFELVNTAYEELKDGEKRAEALKEYRLTRRDRLDLVEIELSQLEESLDSFIDSFVRSKLEREFSPLSEIGVVLLQEIKLRAGAQPSYRGGDWIEGIEKDLEADLLDRYKVLRINGESVQMTSLLYDDESYPVPKSAQALTSVNWGIRTGKPRSKFIIADRWYKKDQESQDLINDGIKSGAKKPTGPKQVLYRFEEVNPKRHDLVLIGSISSEVFEATQQPTKGLKALPVGLTSENTGSNKKSGSSYEGAKVYVRSLESNFAAGNYLVGCRKVEEEIRYYIIGQILSFQDIK